MPITPASSGTSNSSFYINMPPESDDSGVGIGRQVENNGSSVSIDLPTESNESETHLSIGEQRAAWIATVTQQAIVSGFSWGFCNKLPPLIGGAIGGLPGAITGHFIGGILLGSAHYLTETACSNARIAIGRGCQYTPDTNAAKDQLFRDGAFVGLFVCGSMVKAYMKPAILPQGESHTLAAAATGVAAGAGIDTGMSAVIGAASQIVTSSRKYIIGGTPGYKPISSSPMNWREPATRVTAGLGVAAISSGFEIMNNCIKASPAGGVRTAAQIMSGGLNLAASLPVWFDIRRGISNLPSSTNGDHALTEVVTITDRTNLPSPSASLRRSDSGDTVVTITEA